MIRYCLYIRHLSSKAYYETLRSSGVLQLPSQRTLRDYSHCIRAEAGFSTAVDKQLQSACRIKSCQDYEKLVILLLNEIHIKESLVFYKNTGRLIGFTDLGYITNHLIAYERSIELNDKSHKSMMVMMVRGLFSNLRYPYAQFPCSSITGEQLFQPFWEAIYRLERMCLKVGI